MRKAQNLVEILLLAGVLVVVAFFIMTKANDQKIRLANLSKSTLQSVNLSTMSTNKAKETVPYSAAETAGALSLKLIGMSADQFSAAMSSLTYAELKKALTEKDSEGKDIADYANSLIESLNLDYDEITIDNVSSNTLSDLTGILNKVSSSPNLSDPQSMESKFVDRFNMLLDVKTSTGPEATSSTSFN